MLYRLLITCLILPLFLAMPAKAADFAVKDIRLGHHPDRLRIVLEVSGDPIFRSFTLSDPDRLVIDTQTADWQVASTPYDQNGWIDGIRHDDFSTTISRIVFDLTKPLSIKTAFFLPADDQYNKPPRLVIDLVNGHGNSGVIGDTGHALFSGKQSIQQASADKKPDNDYKPIIVIDAGHGGVDPGAIARDGTKEKHITLAVAKRLRLQLQNTGRYRVVLTRDRDIYLKLGQRTAMARRANADLFLSLHADSINKPNIRGASVYTLSETASDSVAAGLAKRENEADDIMGVDLTHQDPDVADILVDLVMRDTMNQSKIFADMLVKQLQTNQIRLLRNTHRFAGFVVLKAPDTPAVLVEMGFMSHPRDVRLLKSPGYHKRLADAIIDGIDSYFNRVAEYNGG